MHFSALLDAGLPVLCISCLVVRDVIFVSWHDYGLPYVIGQAIIFLPCGFFYLLLSIFFSSPDLSHRRLGVYHASTHGVTLVQISDAGRKRAARGSLKIQDTKNCQKFAICAPSNNFVGLYLRN